MNKVYLALIICTYKREDYLLGNLALLKNSLFFTDKESKYYDKIHIFVIDNASELDFETDAHIHLIHNSNNGGSGGFQRGIEEVRKSGIEFSNVIFMDDDVRFELSSFYILFDYLSEVSCEFIDHPVAGRMLDLDNPNIQWTAAEKWNGGNIQHVEFLRDITDHDNPYTPGKVICDADADYGGFWFCCYPYSYVKDNDILPFFIHCDDVEYGIRCGKNPIIIEGVHVWHKTWVNRRDNLLYYFDKRNTVILNRKLGIIRNWKEYLPKWKADISELHINGNYGLEYISIKAFNDAIKKYSSIVNKHKNVEKIPKVFPLDNGSKSVFLHNKLFWRYVFLKVIILSVLEGKNETSR